MKKRCDNLITELQLGADQTIAFFRSLTETELNKQVYQDGACWTVKQIVAHLATIEVSMQALFKNILAGGSGAPEDFDIDRYNRSQTAKLSDKSLDELLARFSEVRRATIDLVTDMSEDDLNREGFHAFHGHGKLERFIRWAYEHARLHEDDIRETLEKD